MIGAIRKKRNQRRDINPEWDDGMNQSGKMPYFFLYVSAQQLREKHFPYCIKNGSKFVRQYSNSSLLVQENAEQINNCTKFGHQGF